MCLLVVLSRLDEQAPLVVAANRDERLDRPASAMTVLRVAGPRVLGGRDEVAGGTWLAVNEHGVVAGLTNRPAPEGRDASKRSRGELPLACAGHAQASDAVDELASRFVPGDYNPAWLLVGDRLSLHLVDLTGEAVVVEELAPGVHVLENHPLHPESAKAARVRAMVEAGLAGAGAGAELHALSAVLSDHAVGSVDGDPARPVDTLACCVHGDAYGTRSSTLVVVPAEHTAMPAVRYTDGPPCTSATIDAGPLWKTSWAC
ncbi:MAG: NRDE family protein [Acidimicrobiales bacterium]